MLFNIKKFYFDFFGFRTLEKAYLSKIKDKVIERIQDITKSFT